MNPYKSTKLRVLVISSFSSFLVFFQVLLSIFEFDFNLNFNFLIEFDIGVSKFLILALLLNLIKYSLIRINVVYNELKALSTIPQIFLTLKISS